MAGSIIRFIDADEADLTVVAEGDGLAGSVAVLDAELGDCDHRRLLAITVQSLW